jgi:DNA (cytosine-5)-methyltransferase 1
MVIGALDTECGGTKMNHQTIASGHIFPVKSFYESSLAQYREANVSGTIKASGGVAGGGSETFLSQPIPIHDQATRHAGKNGDKTMGKGNGLGIGQPGDPMNTLTKGDSHAVAIPIAFPSTLSGTQHASAENIAPSMGAKNPMAVAFNISPGKGELKDDIHVTYAHVSKTIDASASNPAMHQGGAAIVQSVVGALACNTGPNGHDAGNFACNQAVDAGHILPINMAVRRLTPTECERLQGFPDGYTNIPWRKAAESPDGPRYKALGNSWAVPVVAWIGQRIQNQIK